MTSSRKVSLISLFSEIFDKWFEFFWKIYGNLWKSVKICENREWKFPQISVNFQKFSQAWEFPEISTDFRFQKFENVLISHHCHSQFISRKKFFLENIDDMAKIRAEFRNIEIREEFDKCLVSKHGFKKKISLMSPLLEIFWKIYGNLWKSVEILDGNFHRFP